jgi:hypothetical protein
MNWLQYFKLGEKRVVYFRKILIILILLNILFFRSSFLSADAKYCSYSDSICNNLQMNTSISNLSNISGDLEEAGSDESLLNLTNDSSNRSTNSSVNMEKDSIDYRILVERIFFTKIYPLCNHSCYNSYPNTAKLEIGRLIYTPLIILTDVLIAFIISYIIYFFQYYKLEKAKPNDEEAEGEGGEGDKKE